MSLLEADDLFSQGFYIGAVWVKRCGSEIVTIVNGVNRGQRIVARKDVVQPKSAEIFSNGLKRSAENLGRVIATI